MKTEAEIRVSGMQALIGALGLVEAERFLVAVARDKFDYTQWRQTGLPPVNLQDLAQQANHLSAQLNQKLHS